MSEPEEQHRAGLALLADPGAAREWRKAIDLVDAAADAGHADAIERRALFEAMGVGRAADWSKALDSLTLAAERGSQNAAGQLILLAENEFDPTAKSRDWKHVRSCVAVAPLLKAPVARTLSASPLIRTISGFASQAECQWLIAAAAPRLERAIVLNRKTGEHGVDPGRTNQFVPFDLVDMDIVVEMIRARIANAIGAPLPFLEVSQVLHYSVGEEFAPHCDFFDPAKHADEIDRRGQRAATVLIYLNDEFAGGETSFPKLGIEHRGAAGDCLVFSNVDPSGAPDPRTQHAGRPPTSGEKWLFSQWVRDRAPA